MNTNTVENIYIVNPISICEKTDEMLRKEYKIHLITFNKTEEEYSFEQFCKYLEDWKQRKYSVGSFLSSVHIDIEEAKKYVINNIGDINEAGCYNYACISKVPVGITYYESAQNTATDFIVYKYDYQKKEYIELSLDDEMAKEIIKHVWGFVSTFIDLEVRKFLP